VDLARAADTTKPAASACSATGADALAASESAAHVVGPSLGGTLVQVAGRPGWLPDHGGRPRPADSQPTGPGQTLRCQNDAGPIGHVTALPLGL